MPAPPADSQLEELVRRFSRLVRSVAAKVGGVQGSQLADDIEQQVFISLWRQLQREQSITNPSSYLYRSAIRETVRMLNRNRRPDAVGEEEAEEVGVATLDPEERLASTERGTILAEAIRSLPIDRRRAAQAYLAGYSVAEMMQMYGWSYERARNLSTRGMSELRAELKKRGIDG